MITEPLNLLQHHRLPWLTSTPSVHLHPAGKGCINVTQSPDFLAVFCQLAGYVLPKRAAASMGIKEGEAVSPLVLKAVDGRQLVWLSSLLHRSGQLVIKRDGPAQSLNLFPGHH